MITKDYNLNTIKDFDVFVEHSSVTMVKLAVKHFSIKFRQSENNETDEEFFYKQEEVDLFKKLYAQMYQEKLKNFLEKHCEKTENDFRQIFEYVKIEPLYWNDSSNPSCWRVYRLNKNKKRH